MVLPNFHIGPSGGRLLYLLFALSTLWSFIIVVTVKHMTKSIFKQTRLEDGWIP